MTTVYVLEQWTNTVLDHVVGVFSTLELAKAAVPERVWVEDPYHEDGPACWVSDDISEDEPCHEHVNYMLDAHELDSPEGMRGV